MILELRIQNFAVVEDLTVPLAPGLNVVTGETGAGKSIVVDALGILLGGRASSDSVRAGADRAVIEGVLDVAHRPDVLAGLDELGFEADEGHLVLRREINAGGRSRAWVNGSPTTATVVKRLTGSLVDIHGQHEHQRLLQPEYQLQSLDAFAEAGDLATEVRAAHGNVAALESELLALQERHRELERTGDFLRFQLEELRGAELEGPDEEANLDVELARLSHAEELGATSHELHQSLYGADYAVSGEIDQALGRLRRLVELDTTLSDAEASLESAYHLVVDVSGRLRDYADSVEGDPARLELVRERRAMLNGLKRKYGASLADVIAARDGLEAELGAMAAADLNAEALTQRLEEARSALSKLAGQLSTRRREVARRMEVEVGGILPALGLEESTFELHFHHRERPGPLGQEDVEFRVSLNPGFPPASLNRVASGGELSRVMLALKCVLAEVDRVPTLTFDEIDAGVGGAVATQVGD
ncbi:MAG: DNA repair protein RecN, partial [Longimicrobiales bacterium]